LQFLSIGYRSRGLVESGCGPIGETFRGRVISALRGDVTLPQGDAGATFGSPACWAVADTSIFSSNSEALRALASPSEYRPAWHCDRAASESMPIEKSVAGPCFLTAIR
jgi:hypothetical protein